MFQRLILFVHIFFTGVHCYPCDGVYAWKCPNDTMCISRNYELCAPPPFNIQRCPNGGDVGESVCSKEFCKKHGLHKCPFDPFCSYDDYDQNGHSPHTCHLCPHGTTHEVDCTEFSTRSDYNKCDSKRYQK